MTTYHNAVSDKLVISFFPKATLFQAFSKDHTLKYSHVSSDHVIPDAIKSSIFSKTTCVNGRCNFILAPLGEDDYTPYFITNHKTYTKLALENLEQFSVVQDIDDQLSGVIKDLVNPDIKTDVAIWHDAIKGRHANSLYFYHCEDLLTAMVFKDGGLLLINRYAVENHDELFYYIMLLVEQLDLPVQDLHFECIATSGEHEVLQALFKNYLPTLHLAPYGQLQSESSDLRLEHILAGIFSECVL